MAQDILTLMPKVKENLADNIYCPNAFDFPNSSSNMPFGRQDLCCKSFSSSKNALCDYWNLNTHLSH